MPGFPDERKMQADRRIERLTMMYRRAVAGWASSLLALGPLAIWRESDHASDRRDLRWQSLYAGSILDD